MQRGVLQALMNPLSIHVTFTALVPGAYPGEAKILDSLDVAKCFTRKPVRRRHTGVTLVR